MPGTRPIVRLLMLTTLFAAPLVPADEVVFFDDFNAQNGGTPQLNFTDFDGWDISNGLVDLLGPGLFNFYPGNGLYIDMDGSSNNAGTLSTEPLQLEPGAHTLTFDMGYNSGGGIAFNEMSVRVGDLELAFYSGVADLSAVSLTAQTIEFELTQTMTAALVFDHAGGDNGGYIIDNVRLARGSSCPADLNNSGTVDLADLNIVLADFGCIENCAGDTNNSNTTDLADLNAVLAAFGQDCP